MRHGRLDPSVARRFLPLSSGTAHARDYRVRATALQFLATARPKRPLSDSSLPHPLRVCARAPDLWRNAFDGSTPT